MDPQIAHALRNGMTVKDLFEELQDLIDDGMGDHKVCFTYTFPDYWKTRLVIPITVADEEAIEYDGYHNKCAMVTVDDEGDGDDREDDGENLVIVLA